MDSDYLVSWYNLSGQRHDVERKQSSKVPVKACAFSVLISFLLHDRTCTWELLYSICNGFISVSRLINWEDKFWSFSKHNFNPSYKNKVFQKSKKFWINCKFFIGIVIAVDRKKQIVQYIFLLDFY